MKETPVTKPGYYKHKIHNAVKSKCKCLKNEEKTMRAKFGATTTADQISKNTNKYCTPQYLPIENI